MHHPALQKVAERHVFQLSHRLQHFQHASFKPYARLYALDFDKGNRFFWTHVMILPRYIGTINWTAGVPTGAAAVTEKIFDWLTASVPAMMRRQAANHSEHQEDDRDGQHKQEVGDA